MKWMMWAALFVLGVAVGIWLFRRWQENESGIEAIIPQTPEGASEDDALARAS